MESYWKRDLIQVGPWYLDACIPRCPIVKTNSSAVDMPENQCSD